MLDLLLRRAVLLEKGRRDLQRVIAAFDDDKLAGSLPALDQLLELRERAKVVARSLNETDGAVQLEEDLIANVSAFAHAHEGIAEADEAADVFFFEREVTTNARAHALAGQDHFGAVLGLPPTQSLSVCGEKPLMTVGTLPARAHVVVVKGDDRSDFAQVPSIALHPRGLAAEPCTMGKEDPHDAYIVRPSRRKCQLLSLLSLSFHVVRLPLDEAVGQDPGFPMASRFVLPVTPDDSDDVVVALETARVQEERSELEEAARWLQKAAVAARKQGRPDRAGQLSRAAARLVGAPGSSQPPRKFEKSSRSEQTLEEVEESSEKTVIDTVARSREEARPASKHILPSGTPVAPGTDKPPAPLHHAVRVAVRKSLGGRLEARPLGAQEQPDKGEMEALLVPTHAGIKII